MKKNLKKIKTRKIYVLIPVYNDWLSLSKLLRAIDKMIKKNNINILIINDCSTEKNKNSKHQFKNIKSVKVINLKRNVGHDRAIAVGLNILYKKKLFDYVITMDSDGEDNPKDIKSFIEKINEDKNVIIVAKRIKRSENLVFSILYFLHLVILFIFVGKWINFGGYNCLSKLAVKNLLKEKTIWGNYPATIAISKSKIKFLNTHRSKRYYGPSQMTYFKLFLHSLSILAVFKKKIFYKVAVLISVNFLIILLYNNLILYIPAIVLLIFILLILIMSIRENISWRHQVTKNIFSVSKLF